MAKTSLIIKQQRGPEVRGAPVPPVAELRTTSGYIGKFQMCASVSATWALRGRSRA